MQEKKRNSTCSSSKVHMSCVLGWLANIIDFITEVIFLLLTNFKRSFLVAMWHLEKIKQRDENVFQHNKILYQKNYMVC